MSFLGPRTSYLSFFRHKASPLCLFASSPAPLRAREMRLPTLTGQKRDETDGGKDGGKPVGGARGAGGLHGVGRQGPAERDRGGVAPRIRGGGARGARGGGGHRPPQRSQERRASDSNRDGGPIRDRADRRDRGRDPRDRHDRAHP